MERSKRLLIQARDVAILKFLDRVGYANVKQITKSIGSDGIKAQAAVLRRLYMLRRFEYIKVFSTHHGNYYALDNKAMGDNQLINSIKLDQLAHHDFLIELFLLVSSGDYVLSEREVIAKYKIVGKRGKVPDMEINDWIIEYERTNKSVADCKAVVDYWTSEQGKHLYIIYESEEIKNRYMSLLNPRVKLLARTNYKDILWILEQRTGVNNSLQNSIDLDYKSNIINKYS